MGREGWYDEVIRFYDRFLKGEDRTQKDPMVAVQTNDGKWRNEAVWPPADARTFTSTLKTGDVHRRRHRELDRARARRRGSGRSRSRCRTTRTSPAPAA